eukprot:269789-Rhodomonas_salina.2
MVLRGARVVSGAHPGRVRYGAMRCADDHRSFFKTVLPRRMMVRACYAMSGAEVRYGATDQQRRDAQVRGRTTTR